MKRRLTMVALMWSAACGQQRGAPSTFRGAALPNALAKPSFVLTRTDGRRFSFRDDTKGKVVLLYFGYTNCPDICPVHLANIAAALQKLPMDQRPLVDVVFITTDPDRDSDVVLRQYLDQFDHSFIGLRGDLAAVNEIAALTNTGPAAIEPDSTNTPSRYRVSHAAYVLAFTRDDSLRVLYPSGVRQEDWVTDLPKLLRVGATP